MRACARGSRFTVWFGAGFEPATLGVEPMLYPTELSSGGRTGFEPVANGLRRCSTSELSSARGTPSPDPRHAPRQRRAHRTGLVNPRRCGPYERCSALASPTCIESANPCATASACRPCRSIQARRILAPSRCFPASDQQCPDASGARCNRVLIVWWIPLRTPETKRPRVLEPEGVRVASGDRGDRSPRCERISRWWWCRNNSAC